MRTPGLLASLVLVLACGPKDGDGTSGGSSGTESSGGTDSASSGGTRGSAGTRGTDGVSGGTRGGTRGGSGGGDGCRQPEDCKLFTDCCECKAVLASSNPPSCDAGCDQTACDAWGASDVVCRDGACVIAPINCDDSTVTCDAPTPECSDGFSPVVSEDGSCWTGQCAPTELCG